MHPRNVHRQGYNFDLLTKASPELLNHLIKTPVGKDSINFSDAEAVKCLNKALLKHHYKIEYWDIPKAFLCPPVPGRADYIHALADLLKQDNQNKIVNNVSALDIGTGANLIYPILGESIYSWRFIASDINPKAIKNAALICKENNLSTKVLLQPDNTKFFKNILDERLKLHISMCNPPFHNSAESAKSATQNKWHKLGKKPNSNLNFGGHSPELWCEGGEVGFIRRMIKESKNYGQQCAWFSSLVSKKGSLSAIKLALKKANALEVKVIKMEQGQKVSRFVAWSFLNNTKRQTFYQV